jgi:3-oxoacyl-[acyl-carrier-protein] synthase-3
MISIKSISTYIPSNYLNLQNRFKKINKNFLEQKIGAVKVARKEKNETVVQMCMKAYRQLRIKINLKEIKLIVLCTQNPDFNGLPHNSALLQKEIGLGNNLACMDISQGCAGYIYGLKTSESFLKKGEKALFFTCDPYSKIIKKKDYKTELLFGDVATMTILEKNEDKNSKKLISSDFFTNGNFYESIINKKGILNMDGKNVMDFCKNNVPIFIENFLKKNKLKISDIEKFYFHQGSKHIVDILNKSLVLNTLQKSPFIENLGNSVSSSIPLLLFYDKFFKRKKILICGFGVGLSISVGLLT